MRQIWSNPCTSKHCAGWIDRKRVLTCLSSRSGSTVRRGPLFPRWCAPWSESKERTINICSNNKQLTLCTTFTMCGVPWSESLRWWCQDSGLFCGHWWTRSKVEYWCPAEERERSQIQRNPEIKHKKTFQIPTDCRLIWPFFQLKFKES